MTAALHSCEVLNKVETACAPASAPAPAAAPAFTLQITFSPAALTVTAAPVCVGLTALAGYVLLTSLGMPLFARELLAAAIISIVGGVAAALPLAIWSKRGAAAIARAGIVGIFIRCGLVLMGLVLAMGPGWALAHTPLVYWVVVFYFPMMIVETAAVALLCQRAKL